jgi:hypothetical protein
MRREFEIRDVCWPWRWDKFINAKHAFVVQDVAPVSGEHVTDATCPKFYETRCREEAAFASGITQFF